MELDAEGRTRALTALESFTAAPFDAIYVAELLLRRVLPSSRSSGRASRRRLRGILLGLSWYGMMDAVLSEASLFGRLWAVGGARFARSARFRFETFALLVSVGADAALWLAHEDRQPHALRGAAKPMAPKYALPPCVRRP